MIYVSRRSMVQIKCYCYVVNEKLNSVHWRSNESTHWPHKQCEQPAYCVSVEQVLRYINYNKKWPGWVAKFPWCKVKCPIQRYTCAWASVYFCWPSQMIISTSSANTTKASIELNHWLCVSVQNCWVILRQYTELVSSTWWFSVSYELPNELDRNSSRVPLLSPVLLNCPGWMLLLLD